MGYFLSVGPMVGDVSFDAPKGGEFSLGSIRTAGMRPAAAHASASIPKCCLQEN